MRRRRAGRIHGVEAGMQVNSVTGKKRMLITGVSGLLGNNLACYFKTKFYICGLYGSHTAIIDGIKTKKTDL